MKLRTKIWAMWALWLFIPTAYAKEAWIQIQSANFHVISSAGERETKQVVFKLEQFRHFFSQIFPKGQLNAPVPTEVIVFKNAKSFKPFQPLYQGKTTPIAGYFQAGQDKNYIAMYLSAGFDNPYEIIFHEYIHLLLSYNLQAYPIWFQEGLAEFYSNCEINDKDVALGRYHPRHIQTLQESKLIPLESLFQVKHDSPAYNEREKMGIFYAQSWLFIHYFMLGKHPTGQKQLNQFINALAAGRDYTEAFRQAFGTDFQTLQKELDSYAHGSSMKFYRFKLKSIDVDKDFAITTTPPAEVAYYLGDLLVHTNHFDEAQTYLRQALEADPHFAPAHESLGLGYLHRKDFTQAKRHLQAAVEGQSKNHLAHYYYARTLMQELTAQLGVVSSIPEETATAMIEALKKTIRLAPSFADAYDLLGFVYVVRGTSINEGIELLTKAIRLNPSQHEFGLTLAQLYMRKQDFAQAKQTLLNTIRVTQNEGLRARCQQRLETVEEILAHTSRATAAYRSSSPEPRSLENSETDRPKQEETAAAESSPPAQPGRLRITKAPALPLREETLFARGTLIAVDCPATGGFDFVVQTGTQKLTLHAQKAQDLLIFENGQVVQKDLYCGPQNLKVMARYVPRKAADPRTAADGRIVSFTLIKE